MTTEVTLSSLRPRIAAYPPLSRSFSSINYKNQKFLILDCPTDSTLPQYATELLTRHVTDVVRVCEPTYNAAYLAERNIRVHEMYFKDGGVPPSGVVTSWLHLVEERFGPFPVPKKDVRSASTDNLCPPDENGPTIAVHCVAGLGRAPVLVAIALIEAGMPALEAVEFIRRYRRGAFNSVQINFLDQYKRGQHRSGKSTGLTSMGLGLLGRSTPVPGGAAEDKKARPPSPKGGDNRTPSPAPESPTVSNPAIAAPAPAGGKNWLGSLFNKKDKKSPSGAATPAVDAAGHEGGGHSGANGGPPTMVVN